MQTQINRILGIAALLFLAITSSAQAPTFKWGLPSKHPKMTEFDVQVFEASENGFYRVRSKYNLNVFQTEIFIEKYDEKFEKQSEVVATPPSGSTWEANRSFEKYVYNNGKLQVFTSNFFKDRKKNTLFVHDVDFEGNYTNERELTFVEAAKRMQAGDFEIAISENNAYTAVVHEHPFAKKAKEKMTLKLYDADLKELHGKFFELPYPSERVVHHDAFVNNNGDVFILKKIKQPKFKYKYEVLYWDKTKGKVETTSIDTEGKEIIEIEASLNSKGNLVVYGYYCDDIYSKPNALGSLYYEFDGKGAVATRKKLDFEKPIADLSIKALEFSSNGNLIVFSEIFKYDEKMTGTGEGASKDKSYDQGDIVVQKLDASGTTTAINFVKKDNKSKNDGGYLNSFSYVIRGEKIHLFFNYPEQEFAVNKKDASFRKVFVMVTIDENDEMTGVNMYKSGVGVEYGEIPYCPNEFYKITDDSYIMKGASRIEYKFGLMKF